FEREHREGVGDEEEHPRAHHVGERVVEAARLGPEELRAAAGALRDAVRRELALALQEVALAAREQLPPIGHIHSVPPWKTAPSIAPPAASSSPGSRSWAGTAIRRIITRGRISRTRTRPPRAGSRNGCARPAWRSGSMRWGASSAATRPRLPARERSSWARTSTRCATAASTTA